MVNKNGLTKLTRGVNGLLLLLGCALAGTMVVGTIRAIAKNGVPLLALPIVGLFLVGLWLVLKTQQATKRQRLIGLLAVTGLGFVLRLAWILLAEPYAISDFYTMFTASVSLQKGVNPFTTPGAIPAWMQDYFTTWPYQNGFVIFQAFLLRLVGGSSFALHMLNLIMSTAMIPVVAGIGRLLNGARTGLIAAYLMATYGPIVLMGSVFTNQTPATLAYLVGFWALIAAQQHLDNGPAAGRSWWVWVLAVVAGSSLALGNVLRPLGGLLLLACALFWLWYRGVTQPKAFKRVLLLAIVVFGTYAGGMATANVVVTSRGWSPQRLVNRNPLWKLVTGLNDASNGHFSHWRSGQVNQVPLGPERNALEKQIIREELADPGKVTRLMGRKLMYFWTQLDDTDHWAVNNPAARLNAKNWPRWRKLARAVQGMQWLVLLAALPLGLWTIWRPHPSVTDRAALLGVIWFGYVAVHLLIEVQIRYRYFITPIICLLAALGWNALRDHFGLRSHDKRITQR